MKRLGWITGLILLAAGGSVWIARAQVNRNQERLWQLRNIGKARDFDSPGFREAPQHRNSPGF